jgi:hypothetical protein
MLVVAVGNDFKKRNLYVERTVIDLQKKRKDATLSTITTTSGTTDMLTELVGTTGMFDEKRIVILKGVTDLSDDSLVDSKDWQKAIKNIADDLIASEHVFILVAQREYKIIKELADGAYLYKRFIKTEHREKRDMVTFSIAEAFIAKDKKRCWRLFAEALHTKPVEEIHGTILWQLRALQEVQMVSDQQQTTLAPFVYAKTKKYTKLWDNQSLLDKVVRFVEITTGEDRGELEYIVEREILQL